MKLFLQYLQGWLFHEVLASAFGLLAAAWRADFCMEEGLQHGVLVAWFGGVTSGLRVGFCLENWALHELITASFGELATAWRVCNCMDSWLMHGKLVDAWSGSWNICRVSFWFEGCLFPGKLGFASFRGLAAGFRGGYCLEDGSCMIWWTICKLRYWLLHRGLDAAYLRVSRLFEHWLLPRVLEAA